MPNLVGIFDPQATKESLAADLGKMVRAVDLPAFKMLKKRVVHQHVACANVLPGMEDNKSQPVYSKNKRTWLMFDGEILNVGEVRLDLWRKGIDAESMDDAELAFSAYQVFGMGFHERLNGQWNLVLHDGQRKQTYLITDRLGSRILYYAHDGSRFVFGTEAKGVVAGRKVRTQEGGLGFLELMFGGTFTGDRTWLDGIRLVGPGTVVKLTDEGVETRRYFRLRFNESGAEMSEQEYAEGFARHLRAATERCMKLAEEHPIAITLSGGLDSRSVALAIDKRHLPITSLTYGSEDSADVRYAKQLAEVIGFHHQYIEPRWQELADANDAVFSRLDGKSQTVKRGFLSTQLDRICWRSEAMAPFPGLSSTIWHPIYRQYMRFMLNGAAGDAMTGSHLSPRLLLSPSRTQLMDDLRRGVHCQDPELVRKVVNPSFFAEHFASLEPSFRKTFDDIDADQSFAVSNVWDMENRQRRGAFQSFPMERYFCTCRSPYLDYELVDYLAAIPARYRFQQRVYKRMLVREFPEAAHVPWAYTEGKITTSPAYEFAREALNFARSRVEDRLPWNRGKPPRWEFRDVPKMMREDDALYLALDEFLESDSFPDHVLDRDGVRWLADDYRRSEESEGKHILLAQILGISRMNKFVLAAPTIQVPETADPAEFGVSTASG